MAQLTNTLGDEAFEKSNVIYHYLDTDIEKARGKKAIPGEIHKWGNREVVKTQTGWTRVHNKPHSSEGDNNAPKTDASSKAKLQAKLNSNKQAISAYEKQMSRAGYANRNDHPNYGEWERLNKENEAITKALENL